MSAIHQSWNYWSALFNELKTLDVTKNPKLIKLVCPLTMLKVLDLSKNKELQVLICSHNELISLDLSKNTNLRQVDCSMNALKDLNLKNGNNKIIEEVYNIGNVNLKCIRVDDVTWASAQGSWKKDAPTEYSTDCK